MQGEEEDDEERDLGADEGEVIAEIEEALEDLVQSGQLEVASKKGATYLAGPLFNALERRRDLDIAEWLVDRVEVSEVYADEAELRERFARVFARLDGQKTPVKFNEELAASVRARPDDVQAWSVFGDWLSEQGDPRGELIAIQIARSEEKKGSVEERALARREAALLTKYRRHFYGDLWVNEDADPSVEATFRYGYFDAITIRPDPDEDLGPEELVSFAATHESSRFLRSLTVRCPDLGALQGVLDTTPLPRTLTTIDLREEGGYRRNGAIAVRGFTKQLDQLVHLAIQGDGIVTIASLEGATALRELVLRGSELRLHKETLASVPTLEKLSLDGGVKFEPSMARFFESPPRNLGSLAIRNSRSQAFGRLFIDNLLGTPAIKKTLRELTLRFASLFDDSVGKLLDARAEFPLLTSVDLRGNDITTSMQERVTAVWPEAFSNVRGNDDDDRYDDADE